MKTDDKKCFSEFEMGAYIEGSLSPEMKEAFENHFASCDHCWSEFVELNRVIIKESDMLAGEVPEHLIKKAVRMFPEKSGLFDIVLKLVRDSVDVVYSAHDITAFTPLPVSGLRSGKIVRPEMIVLKKSFKDIDVQLDIEKVNENICNIRVSVDTLKNRDLIKGLRVELISEGRELVSVPVEGGETILEDIKTGRYAIKISRKWEIVGQISLKLE